MRCKTNFLRCAALSLFLALGCGTPHKEGQEHIEIKIKVPQAPLTAPTEKNLEKVLIIGIDGCRPDALEAAITTNLDRQISSGVYINHAVTDRHSVSGPSWSSLFTGVWSNEHEVTGNDFCSGAFEKYPPLFTMVENLRPYLNNVSIVSWKPLNEKLLMDGDYLAYYPEYDLRERDIALNAMNHLFYGNPDIMFIHFDSVDAAGHRYGYSPDIPQYISAIEHVDYHIGSILAALEARKSYHKEDWLIICTTDHGGLKEEKSHGGQSKEEVTIFYIINGLKGGLPANDNPAIVDLLPIIYSHLGIAP